MDRRKFIKNTASFATLPILLNGQAINVLASNGFNIEQTNGKVLILIQMDGGNDGLNTLIPLNMYNNLVKVRPEVVLPENKILPLTGLQGLHPSMSKIKELYNNEKMMFLQNVGYPQPNLSHFRSKEIMLSASASKDVVATGWFGRYLELLHPTYPNDYPNNENPHPLAISIGNSGSPTCQGNMNSLSVVLKNLKTNYESQSTDAEFPDTPYGYELEYVTQVMKSTEKYLEVVSNSASLSESISTLWPEGNSLADKLKIVARLISGGLTTPIYIVNLGGFDTHSNQVTEGETDTGKHADLLKKISEASYAFQDELKLQNKEDDVISLVYSEFGRRIGSNKSYGTDHGAAFPMMLFGSQVNPLVYGENPVIPEEVEKKTNVPMDIDFRSVYASILHHWFNVDQTEIENILFNKFELLPILKSTATETNVLNHSKKINLSPVFPNPITNSAQIQFYTKGGEISLKLYSLEGKELKNMVSGKYPEGNQFITFNKNGLINGQYLLILQNGKERVSQKILIQ
jgi:uncharacterized protein (DUF1501 family)